MDLLKERILKDGIALNENVLKVDCFINHQIDSNLMKEIGIDFANHFKNRNITKVFTIESSGIAPALMTSLELGVPLVILKRQTSSTLTDVYQTKVKSFTNFVKSTGSTNSPLGISATASTAIGFALVRAPIHK